MIPVLRPKLPSADRIGPYLARMDRSRWYSNFGPLVCEFEERLASHFNIDDGTIATVANGTLGLVAAIMAQGAPPGTLCVVPAWTFVASVNAVVLAGLTPYFVDVDASTWALEPNDVEERIADAPGPVGAVMVVAPFGQPIEYAAWDDFTRRTGLPVVIDAAAAFDTLRVCENPIVVSLHATKILGTGEGGFVASRNKSVIQNIRQRSNFGFDRHRNCVVAALNAKLSEYHAAVGLASLDAWNNTREEWMSVASAYRRAAAKSNGVNLQLGFGETWVSSTCIVSVEERVHANALRALAAVEIQTRLWWGNGAHRQPATAVFRGADLPVTESLARSAIGVPLYRDLQVDQVQRIVTTIDAVAS
jgi:dTDP-4-amino-4,6-dideoxygalactose transaminase